jgi:hypothetical protein
MAVEMVALEQRSKRAEKRGQLPQARQLWDLREELQHARSLLLREHLQFKR